MRASVRGRPDPTVPTNGPLNGVKRKVVHRMGSSATGGGSGIRTHGGSRPTAFQEPRIRPLCHPSPGDPHRRRPPLPYRPSPTSPVTWPMVRTQPAVGAPVHVVLTLNLVVGNRGQEGQKDASTRYFLGRAAGQAGQSPLSEWNPACVDRQPGLTCLQRPAVSSENVFGRWAWPVADRGEGQWTKRCWGGWWRWPPPTSTAD